MNPFIPRNRARSIIVDGRVSREIYDNLRTLNLRVIKTIKCSKVQEAISYHPDIVIHPINHNTYITSPDMFNYYSEIFKKDDVKLIKGDTCLGYNYPEDIPYNVGRVGNYAVHNLKYTDEKLKYYLEKEGIEFIDVKQGYSKCSLGVIGNNQAITSDDTIYKKLSQRGVKVLLIEEGDIELTGFNYGFIGGSMGNIDEDRVLFAGSLVGNKNEDRIRKYIGQENKEIVELSTNKLVDLGSLIGVSI